MSIRDIEGAQNQAAMEQDGERNQDRATGYPGYESDLSASYDPFPLKSTSPNQMKSGVDAGVNTDHADDVEPWKEALISRNMDLVNCCLQAILGDLPSSERPYIGQLMTTVMKEVEDIAVEKVELTAQSIFTKLESPSVEEPVEKTIKCDQENSNPEKDAKQPMKIPNIYNNKRPNSRTNVRRKPPAQSRSFKSFVCPGCERFVHDKTICPACHSFVTRLEKEIQNGRATLSCKHKDFKGAPTCRCCRFHKYNELWRFKKKSSMSAAPHQEGPTVGGRVCLGCQTSLNEGATRCSSCFSLVRKILKARNQGSPIPYCRHENYAGCPKCERCRFNRFLKRKNLPPFRCGSCFQVCTSDKCQACHNFGTSLEKAYGKDSIPQCLHQNREGAPSCLNCRYHHWKEGKRQPIEAYSEKPQEKDDRSKKKPAMDWIKQEPGVDVKPNMKRIKMEIGSPFEFEMA